MAAGGRPGYGSPGDIFANRFRIEKHLGSGSLTTAYLVSAPGVAKPFCLKILHPRKASEPHWVKEWVGLQRAVARYEAPGIARMYEADIFGATPWCTMEYLPGPTLRLWMLEKLQFAGRIPAGVEILRALVRIFESIHDLGCYGVLKPENIFITPRGPVITDFGVPGFLTPQEFEFNAYARRYLPYMAPELRQDFANLLPQSDFYSLGALLYEILTGRPPDSPLKLPSALSPVFGIEADEVILKSLAENPQHRFGGPAAFASALTALRESLQKRRPEAFAPDPSEIEEPATGTIAIHAPALVGDPEEDFEFKASTPPESMPKDWVEAKREPETSHFDLADLNKVGSLDFSLPEAPAAEPPKLSQIESPWAALEADMTAGRLARKTAPPSGATALATLNPKGLSEPAPPALPLTAPKAEDWLASPPTPAWVWVLLIAFGLALTALAVFMGLRFGH